MELIRSFLEWGPWLLAATFVAGVLLGNIVRSLNLRLWLGFGLILVPPLTCAALYWRASSAACAGVDCSNTVLALIYLGAFAIIPICLGLGTLFGSMIAGIRRTINAWVTPRAEHANGAQ